MNSRQQNSTPNHGSQFRIEAQLRFCHQRGFFALKGILNSPHWYWRIALLATLLSLVLATPRLEIFTGHIENLGDLSAKFAKMEAPLKFHEYEPGSHNAKVAFRMTGHTIAHILGLDYRGHKILEFLSGYFLFVYTSLLAYRITCSRFSAALATLYIAVIYAGCTAFVEFRMTYDGLGVLLLTMAIYHCHWFITGLCVYLSSFTDERGLIASCLVMTYHCFETLDRQGGWRGLWRSPPVVSVGVAWLFYFLTRYGLIEFYGFRTDSGKTSLFFEQANNLAVGVWSAMEGGWLLVLLALMALAVQQRLRLLVLLFQILLVIWVAMSVEDITRSMAYLVPVLFISLRILANQASTVFVYRCLLIALIISAVWPSAYFWGSEQQWWHAPPLPIQIVRTFFMSS